MSHYNAGIAANSYINTWQGRSFESFEDCRDAYFAALAPEADKAMWETGFAKHDLVIGSNVKLRALHHDHLNGIPRAYAIVLYETEIVRYYGDGTMSVDNGGFNTPTTSRRIAQFSPPWLWVWHAHKKLVTGIENVGGEKDMRHYGRELKILTHDFRFPVKRAVDEKPDEPRENL